MTVPLTTTPAGLPAKVSEAFTMFSRARQVIARVFVPSLDLYPDGALTFENAQVVCRCLRSALPDGVRVGTVDKLRAVAFGQDNPALGLGAGNFEARGGRGAAVGAGAGELAGARPDPARRRSVAMSIWS